MDIVYCSIMLFCGCFSYLVVFTFFAVKSISERKAAGSQRLSAPFFHGVNQFHDHLVSGSGYAAFF